MRTLLHNITSLILKLSLPLTAFLVPLTFLPLTVDLFTPHKQLVLLIIAAITLVAWAVQTVLRKEIRLAPGPALLPVLILGIVYIVSSFIQSPNMIEALRGQTSSIVALGLIFLATTSTLSSRDNLMRVFRALFASLIAISLVQIIAFLGVATSVAPWLAAKSFNPTGGPLPFLTLALPLIPAAIFLGLKGEGMVNKVLAFAAAVFGVIGSLMAVSLLLPDGGNPLVLLPLSAGWPIAIEIFKDPRTALFGTGPGTFANTFSLLKPISLNAGPWWNVRFGSSSNEFLTILTTVGLLGMAAYLWATLRSFTKHLNNKEMRQPVSVALRITLGLVLILQLLVPASVVLITLTFLCLALVTIDLKAGNHLEEVIISLFALKAAKPEHPELAERTSSRGTEILPWFLLVFSVLLVVAGFALNTKAYAAQLTYFRSLQAAAANKGADTYNLQIEAINLNPYDPLLRMSYSQTNLALANALAAKGDLSDQDRNNITQLIQQAIREAKAATTLDARNSLTWANLGSVYRQLLNLAEGADQWTIASFTQAAQLDPANPQLRLDLGGVYYTLGNFDQALGFFQQAATLKSDWANAYYNLAAVYKEKKDYVSAAQSLQNVLRLLDPTAADYGRVQEELVALERMAKEETEPTVDETAARSTEPLVTPTPLPSPTVSPIELPDSAGLNITPTPSETPTPTQ